jgi:hypothetical protein
MSEDLRVRCETCRVYGPDGTTEADARWAAIRAGWSTARGRELCVGCTARHNANLGPTPDVALATNWEPAHVEAPGRRKVTTKRPASPPNSKEQTSDGP